MVHLCSPAPARPPIMQSPENSHLRLRNHFRLSGAGSGAAQLSFASSASHFFAFSPISGHLCRRLNQLASLQYQQQQQDTNTLNHHNNHALRARNTGTQNYNNKWQWNRI